MFYCQPDMTSAFVLHQGALHTRLHDGFQKRTHDFVIAFHSNFIFGMHGFRDNEVVLQAGYDLIAISPLGGVSHTQILMTESERATHVS